MRGVGFLLLPYPSAHFAHWYCISMGLAVCVGEVFVQVLGAGWAVVVPDIVDKPFPRLEGAVFSGDRVAACE